MHRIYALIELRVKTLLRGARGPAGTLGRIIGLLVMLLGVGLALAMAAGFGALLYFAVDSGDERVLRVSLWVAFYTFFFFGLVLPFVTSTIQQALDVSPLRIFPIERWRLFAVQLASALGGTEHLFYYPSLITVLFFGALQPGLPLITSSALGLALLAFYGVWGNAINLVLGGVMRRRRWREILGIVVLSVVIVASFLPALLDPDVGPSRERALPVVERALPAVIAVTDTLPPSLAARGIMALHRGDDGVARAALGGLALWNVAGLALGYLAFVRFHIGDAPRMRRRARARKNHGDGETSRRHLFFDHPAFARLPRETRAVAAKDLHYLFRSTVGKFVLVVLPLFVAVVAVMFVERIDGPVLGMSPQKLVFLAMLFYTTLFSNNLVSNAYAWDGDGAKLYFSTPTRLAAVVAGKNLALWIYNVLLLTVALTCWSLLVAPPSPLTLVTALLTFAVGLLALTTCGNLLSIYFPVRRNMSGMNSSPAQASIAISLITVIVAAALVWAFLFVPTLLGIEALQPVALALLLGLQILAYRGVLGLSARLLSQRREAFLESVCRER